jgi:hypothetical protein
MPHTTTNDTLPPALRNKYALTSPINGGPVYVFPQYGGMRVDFSKLTERQAESLLARGWPGICRVTVPSSQRRGRGAPDRQTELTDITPPTPDPPPHGEVQE